MAGWTPRLTEAQVSRLTEAATGGASRDQFVAALHGETGLGITWTEGFLASAVARTATDPETTVEPNGKLS